MEEEEDEVNVKPTWDLIKFRNPMIWFDALWRDVERFLRFILHHLVHSSVNDILVFIPLISDCHHNRAAF